MKKVLQILKKIAVFVVVVTAIAMMIFTLISVNTFDRNDRSIFGFKFYIVQTDSMSLSENNKDMDVHFNAGDIVIIKNVKNLTTFQAGDVIAFMSTNSDSYGETLTHMIREVKRTEEGQLLGYVTFGTNTGTDDEALVEPSYVLGSYSGKLPLLGNFFAFVKSTPGYIVCILVPFLLLILYNGINVIFLFRKYKKEQTMILEEEKAELAAERKQNEEMMRELLALKAQLDQKSEEASASDAPKTENKEASESTEDGSENN